MRIAIYPGTFDPITYGHIDILERACPLFDHMIIAIARNPAKEPMFSVAERKEMIIDATKDFSNIDVDAFDGLVVEYACLRHATVILRGLRAVSDFEYELQMALMNRSLNENIVTVFLMPHEKYIYLNSSVVKEVASFGGDVSHLVPPLVVQRLQEKLAKNQGTTLKKL